MLVLTLVKNFVVLLVLTLVKNFWIVLVPQIAL